MYTTSISPTARRCGTIRRVRNQRRFCKLQNLRDRLGLPAIRVFNAVRGALPVPLLLATILLVGCGSTVRQAAKEATPGAVEGAVDTAHHPKVREDLAEILADPRIREAMTELTQSIVGGGVDALSEPERAAKLDAFAQGLVQRVSKGLAKSMTDELRPQLAAMVAGATQQAMQQILSAENEQRATEFTVAVSRAAARGITEELSTGDATAANNRINDLSKQAAQGFAVGFEQAVDRSLARREAGDTHQNQVLASVGRVARTSLSLFSIGGIIVVLIVLALLGALIAEFILARRYRRESQLRGNTLASLLRAHPELGSDGHAQP